MQQHWLNYIAGEWCDSANTIAVDNPATGENWASIACASTQDVERAVFAARTCFNSGTLTDCRPAERAAMLYRIAQALNEYIEEGTKLAVLENGKTHNDARDELKEAVRYFEYYAGMADKLEGKSIPLGKNYMDFTLYEPHGISVHIIPWNFPVSLCARSLAPALAAGNTVIIKSPELAPLAITVIAKACEQAGVPAGAVNLLCGYGQQTGAQLVTHKDIDHIVFTGSVATGQAILTAAAQRAVPCVMELGGKSAAVVFADANLDQLIDSVKWGVFFNAGQVCSAMSRLLVERSIYDQVLTRLSILAQQQTIDENTLTPLISKQQQQKVSALCDRAKTQGARLLCGGTAMTDRVGYFYPATLFADVTPDMELFQQEVFGPVLAITPFDSEAEAWKLANETQYGLVAGIFTQDISRSLRGAQKLKAGQVFINEWFAGGVETPFGGTGLSGYGREKGIEALYGYVHTKNIAIRL